MTPVELRPMREGDRDTVIDLWVESWTAAMPSIDFEARRGWFAEHLARLARERVHVTVAAADDVPVGLVTVDPATGVLDQLVVAPAAKGGGVATALLAHAKSAAPAGLRLHVNADNPRALRFYEREGFRRIEQGINPRSGLPTWSMRWP